MIQFNGQKDAQDLAHEAVEEFVNASVTEPHFVTCHEGGRTYSNLDEKAGAAPIK